MFLVPVRIDDDFRNDDTGIAKMLLRRVSAECAINGFATLSKIALSLRKAVIARYSLKHWTDNPFIRMLSYYLSTINSPSDPFLENATGIITTPKFDPATKSMPKDEKDRFLLKNAPIYGDTMVSIRCLLLINSAFFYFSGVMPASELAPMVEIVRYMFQSPYVNGDKLKSIISPLKQKCFLLAPRSSVNLGYEYVFQEPGGPPSPLSFTSALYPNASHAFFHATSEPYYKSIESLKDISPLSADRYLYLLSAPVSHASLEIYKWWTLPETVIGFIDNSIMHTAVAQYSGAPILTEKPPIFEAVFLKYVKIYSEGLSQRNTPRTFDEMVNTISRYAITTSSGLGRTKVTIKDPATGEPIEVAIGNKLAAFLSKGEEIFSKQFFDKLMTEEFPAKAGTRKTVARKKRIIGNDPFTIIAIESSVASIKDEFAKKTENFGTTGATSNPFNDFKRFISDIPYTNAYFCRDADAWDACFQYFNGRLPQIEAILSLPDDMWPKFDFLGFKSIKEMILSVMEKYNHIWLEIRDMKFAPPKNDDGSKAKLLLRARMILNLVVVMLSGALGTFFDNSVINLGIAETMYGAMANKGISFSKFFKVLFNSVTGDDAADILKIASEPDMDIISQIISFNTEYMKANGFVTKDQKTEFSCTLNYLKKVWIGNAHVPRPSIQPYSKESKSMSLSKLETISNRWGLFNAIIARGADVKFMHHLILSEWNAIRYYDNSKLGAKLGEDNIVDFYAVFLPPSYGGAGVPFFPSVGYGLLSNDLMSFMYPDFRYRLTTVKSILSPIVERREMIRSISREPDVVKTFEKGIQFAIKGIKPRRMETAVFLLDKYSDRLRNFKFNGLSILQHKELLLGSVSETIGNSIPKRFHIKHLKKAILENSKFDMFLEDTGIFAKFKYVFTDKIVEPRFASIPIVGLDPVLYNLYRICGISDRDYTNVAAIERALHGLIAHGLPRQISADAVIETLTQGDYATDPEIQTVALTIMGVDYPQAAKFISQFGPSLPYYSVMSSKHGISLGSESLSGMYTGPDLLDLVAEIEVNLTLRERSFLSPAIIYMFIQGYFLHGEARKLSIQEISVRQTRMFRRKIYLLNKTPDLTALDQTLDSFFKEMEVREEEKRAKAAHTR
jgi:hypothetical protein